MVVDEDYIESEPDVINIAPICYHCSFYFGPITYGFCRRFEMWVKTSRSCVWFEANRNDWS